MKTFPLHEVARELGIHPLNLILRLQQFVGSLEECWPTVEEGYYETVKAMWRERKSIPAPATSNQKAPPAPSRTPRITVSPGAARVVEKLWRKDKWGDRSVSLESLQKMCQDVIDIDEAIEELRHLGLLQGNGKRGPFSLVSARNADIEVIAKANIQ